MVITKCPAPKQLRRNWTNVHDPMLACHSSAGDPISLQPPAAASDNDVFNDIAALEEYLVETYCTNLQGNIIMSDSKLTSMANALLNANVTTHTIGTSNAYYDVLDTLENHLGLHPMLYAQVMASMAWMVDASCIAQARTVLFARWGEYDQTNSTFNDFCLNIMEELDHESLYADDTPEHQLAQLLALREHWHDAASAAAAANDKDYKQRSLREQLENEKPAIANVGTRVNYKLIAEREAKGDKAKEARLLEAYIQSDAINMEQRVENNKKLLPTVMVVLQAAMRYKPDFIRFDEMPAGTQKRLTQFAITTIDRIKLDVARRLSNQPIAFGHMLEAAYDVTEALNNIIATKYTDAGELENTSSQADIDHGRRQKRIAANTL